MQAVEKALDVAVMVAKNGGSTAVAERAFANILKGYGQEGVSVIWRLDFVAAMMQVEGVTKTALRPIEMAGLNLVRSSAAVTLAEQFAKRGAKTIDLNAEIAQNAERRPEAVSCFYAPFRHGVPCFYASFSGKACDAWAPVLTHGA